MNGPVWRRPPAGRWLHCLLLVGGALLLAGCLSPPDEPPTPTALGAATAPPAPAARGETATATTPPSPTPTPRPTQTPAPTPTPTPTPTALPPTPCPPGTVTSTTFASAVAGADHAVRLYLPPCYEAQERLYPTLYLFSGNIHDESKWDELGVDEAAERLIADGEIPPLLIVMADGGRLANNTSGGPGSYESLVLEELIPWVESTYCAWADPEGRAIGGLSRGGYWALEIAFRHPQQFASAGGHSAALLDEYAGPAVNPQITALNNDLGDLRIYLDIGRDDYLRANTIRLHEEMAAQGVPHTWILQEGRHDDAYWAAHAADYLRWYAAPWAQAPTAYPACAGR